MADGSVPRTTLHDGAFKAFLAVALRAPDLCVGINRKVEADYRARGLFPEVTELDFFSSSSATVASFRVPDAVAREMLADAIAQAAREKVMGNRRATRWSWLRNQLLRDLGYWGLPEAEVLQQLGATVPRRKCDPSEAREQANTHAHAHIPLERSQPRGDIRNHSNEPSVTSEVERILLADINDLTDSDLAWLVRQTMISEGVKPLSRADNLMAHLRFRIEQRERAGR